MILCFYFFFFKQKTAYEIGLGIPAEPLFRSHAYSIVIGGIQGDVLATDNNTVGMGDAGIKSAIQGSNVPNPDEAVPSFVSGAMEIGRASCRERVWIVVGRVAGT